MTEYQDIGPAKWALECCLLEVSISLPSNPQNMSNAYYWLRRAETDGDV